jgi:hypothetical protein
MLSSAEGVMTDLEGPDELWERIEPLLPKAERRHRWPGRKRLDDRACLARHPVRARHRHPVGASPTATELRVRRDLLASPAGLDPGRLAVRWEYRADIRIGFLKLAACIICWRHLEQVF